GSGHAQRPVLDPALVQELALARILGCVRQAGGKGTLRPRYPGNVVVRSREGGEDRAGRITDGVDCERYRLYRVRDHALSIAPALRLVAPYQAISAGSQDGAAGRRGSGSLPWGRATDAARVISLGISRQN